jgi:hypothetical protein
VILINVNDLFGAQVFLLDLVIEIILSELSEPGLGRFYPLSMKQFDHLCADDRIVVFYYDLAQFHFCLPALIIVEIGHKLKPISQECLEFVTVFTKHVWKRGAGKDPDMNCGG